ncbi:MAG: hypothetical protein U0S48_06085 [Solirubrobacteraceae bacterium]
MTAYLLNDESRAAMAAEASTMTFPHEYGEALVRDLDHRLPRVALPQTAVLADARAAGLTVDRLAYGSWTGRPRLTLQDVVVLRRDP